MREQLESLLAVLGLGSIVAIAAKRVGIPYNVALVVIGLVAVFTDVLPQTPMDPELILVVFLPILIFEAALFADADALQSASRPILALALPGVAFSLFATAGVATLVMGLPFPVALLLGALLAITDTVSVLLAFRSVRAPHRLAAIMEGESLFNDGTALVLVTLTSTVVATNHFDSVATLRALAVSIFGGAGFGVAFGAIGSLILRRSPDHLTTILASFVLVFATALTTEHVHASAVISVVVVGLFVGHTARKYLEPSRVLAMQGFWETTGFCLNVLLFLLVGMQIRTSVLIEEAGTIGLAVVALHLGRAVAVYLCFLLLRLVSRERVPLKWQHLFVFGNIKGALSMAAVLALPGNLPYRERLIAIVFGVTFVTLVTQGLNFRGFLVFLKLGREENRDIDMAKAALVAARRGQIELDELLAAGLVSRKEHAERRALFQRQVIAAETALRGPSGEDVRDHMADVSLLEAQKAALLDGARRGLFSTDTAEAHVANLDRELMKLHNEGH